MGERVLTAEEVQTTLRFIGAAGMAERAEDIQKLAASHEELRRRLDPEDEAHRRTLADRDDARASHAALRGGGERKG